MFKPDWLRLPSRVALILGLGALSSAGVRADTLDQSNRTASGDVLVRSEGGKIFLTERGRETELRLGATAQRNLLLRLLEEHGPAGVKLDGDPRLLLAGGAGAGFSLRDVAKSLIGKPASGSKAAPASARPNAPKQETAPRDSNPPVDKKG
jgi:hypothetical protein